MAEIWETLSIYGEEPIKFYSREQALEWAKKELNVWDWLWSAEVGGPLNQSAFGEARNMWLHLVRYLEMEDPQSNQQYIQLKNQNFNGHLQNPIVSGSSRGQAVLNAYERLGVREARWVYRLNSGSVEISPIRELADIRGLFAAANPTLVDQLSIAEELQKERATYRAAVTKLGNRVRELEKEARDAEAKRVRQRRKVVLKFKEIFRKNAKAMSSDFTTQSRNSIAKITDTEDRYRKQMELRAPVEYWKAKSEKHGHWEKWLASGSIIYFIAASLMIYCASKNAANYILSLPEKIDRTPLYIITSGALLGFTTLVFWIGRLVIKLWLSEHHLRVDADERSIMTQTYLALTEKDAATENERAIVLASIFRPTPDGVVKEDGPAEVGLNVLLAKFLSK